MSGYIGSSSPVVSNGAERKYEFTATASQTTFSPVVYSPGLVHVFQNGVRLDDGVDFTATNGSSIVLTVGADENDHILVISYASYQVADSYTKSEADVRYVNVTSGTSMPVGPSLGDEVYRTDLDKWFKYNGTIWMEL